MVYRTGVVAVEHLDSREYVPVVTVQQGRQRMLVSSRAVRGFMAARFAAGELARKLAGKFVAEKANGLVDRKATQAAV